MSIKSSLFVLLFFAVNAGKAQTPDDDNAKLYYEKEYVGGIQVHTNGWGVTFREGKHKTGFSKHLFGGDFVYMKHSKEVKSYNPWYKDSKGYIYGKQNSLFILRGYYGQRYSLTDKIRTRGVDVGFLWNAGISLGLAKPVYLEIGHPSVPYDFITVEKYDVDKHYVDNIYGRASGAKGIGEIVVYPGIHSKFAFLFEYSPENDGIKGLETGISMDAYFKNVPIMANTKNRQVFITLYLDILIGKKQIR